MTCIIIIILHNNIYYIKMILCVAEGVNVGAYLSILYLRVCAVKF